MSHLGGTEIELLLLHMERTRLRLTAAVPWYMEAKTESGRGMYENTFISRLL